MDDEQPSTLELRDLKTRSWLLSEAIDELIASKLAAWPVRNDAIAEFREAAVCKALTDSLARALKMDAVEDGTFDETVELLRRRIGELQPRRRPPHLHLIA